MSEGTVARIKSRGFWEVSISPRDYVTERLAHGQLKAILEKSAVRLRGWPVPMVDYRQQIVSGNDWISQEIDASVVDHYEAWRFYTSGLFTQLRAISADWRTGKDQTPIPSGFESVIEVWEILYYVTELVELAARLALTPAGGDEMVVSVSLHGLNGRCLVIGQRERVEFSLPYAAPVELDRSTTIGRDALIADPRGAAIDMAQEMFSRFGWNPSREQLVGHQGELARP